jgi:hypothetical protein
MLDLMFDHVKWPFIAIMFQDIRSRCSRWKE